MRVLLAAVLFAIPSVAFAQFGNPNPTYSQMPVPYGATTPPPVNTTPQFNPWTGVQSPSQGQLYQQQYQVDAQRQQQMMMQQEQQNQRTRCWAAGGGLPGC